MLFAVSTSTVSPHSIELQAQLLHGLSDPSRLRILEELRDEEKRVVDLVRATGLSQPNVSKHLNCLWGCGLVAREKRGREVHYWLIEGVDELLRAVGVVLDQAGETVGSCRLTASTVDGCC
jgi:ArsR family transcriptional regulator, cadmium/lead-responsive transcriptional repressor